MAALLIFVAVYVVLAAGRLPFLRIDRTGACIIGASLMVATGVMPLAEAWASINFDTIVLLFGMMIVVANLRLSGFFAAVAEWVVEHAHRPIVLLAAVVLVAGFFSAFFVNDTMCLVLTPLVLEITKQLRRNPVPYLLAVAMASNIGSVATITGNPQNMMVGSFSGIHYRVFTAALAPIGAVGLVLTIGVIALFYRREFSLGEQATVDRRPVRTNKVLMWKSVAVSAGMIVLFFVGRPVPQVALLAGAILLITRRVKPEKVYREIDWSLLVLFAGLFVVIAGVEKTSLPEDLFRIAQRFGLERTFALSTFAALLSNIVSNVPAVLVFKPFIARLQNPAHSWLALAMSTTLAGNLTLLGSVANLIVVQKARHEVQIGFWEYFRTGAPLAVLTIAAGVLMLG
ncbi:MAG: Citrate transporter [Bryobacterales bacterium]|nr:Citrate transporter [Bryobacterales bacterium]